MNDNADAAYEVLRQVRPLFQASGRAVDRALQGSGLTVPARAVVEHLLGRGPATVPAVAREFAVTRQSIQTLVDGAVGRGLLELIDNPQHRRSRLVGVTEQGRRTFAALHRRELRDLARVTADLDADELARCARLLATLTDRVRRLPGGDHDHDADPDPQLEP